MTDLFQSSVTVDPFLPFSYPDSLGPLHIKCCFHLPSFVKAYDLAMYTYLDNAEGKGRRHGEAEEE